MAQDENQVRPDYGPVPKGKANIMRQGQTETNAWGQDPMLEGVAGQVVRDNPDL